MPNWVINKLYIEQNNRPLLSENPELWEEIENYVQSHPDEDGETQVFDFCSIVPQPPGLYDDNTMNGTSMPDWYTWCVANWGTKWNACEAVRYVNESRYVFQTAWSTPEPVIRALSEKFPTVTFAVDFADEDLGNNCGVYIYEDGKIVNYEIGDREFACDMWGFYPEEFEDEEEEVE